MSTPAAPASASQAAQNAEAERLADLHSYGILDTPPEPQFDNIVALARMLFNTPIAAISLIDQDRQWFKARSGLEPDETPRDESFCTRAIEQDGVLVVNDARQDQRFANLEPVRGPTGVRFYAGAPLRNAQGHKLGAVCIISTDPRGAFPQEDCKRLEMLADIVVNEMELRRQAIDARKSLNDTLSAYREAQYRLKNSLDYATLLAEVQAEDMTTDRLTAVASAAWKQYSEAGGVLMAAIKSLRTRLPAAEYKALLDSMPGFIL